MRTKGRAYHFVGVDSQGHKCGHEHADPRSAKSCSGYAARLVGCIKVGPGDLACISSIVGRLHVGTRYVQVLRHVKGRLEGVWPFLGRKNRRAIAAAAFLAHGKNRELYRWVMGSH